MPHPECNRPVKGKFVYSGSFAIYGSLNVHVLEHISKNQGVKLKTLPRVEGVRGFILL
jgi:hypothetical protein